MRRAGDTFYNSTLRSLAYGFLFCIAVPVIAFVCLILVVGVPAGLILLFNYVILLLLSTVITSVVSANWLNNLGNKRFGYWKLCFSALALFVLFKILTFTPFFGWFIMALFVFIAFGAILQNIRWRREKPGPMTA
jgi:hypothetical protein